MADGASRKFLDPSQRRTLKADLNDGPSLMKRVLGFHVEQWALPQPFHIAERTFEGFDCVGDELAEDNMGHGAAPGIYYTGDQLPALVAQRENARAEIPGGFNHQSGLVTVGPDFCLGTGVSTT